MSARDCITVSVVWSPGPRQVEQHELRLPHGSDVHDALRACHFWHEGEPACVGIWGRKAALDEVLSQGDRIEIYRPLRVDPKFARRERFARQGAGPAGLFAQRRPEAKP